MLKYINEGGKNITGVFCGLSCLANFFFFFFCNLFLSFKILRKQLQKVWKKIEAQILYS